MMEMTFDIERARFGKAARGLGMDRPVFVAGLARGGTSIFTRLLHQSGQFASPTYADMPFPLAPNSWARFTRTSRRALASRPRGHGDGLEHDLDTPEAIEEAFWRCFEGDEYISVAGLRPVPPQHETIGRFREFVALMCLRHGIARYLSKNNNNILRLPALVEGFPQAVLVHPFRAPAQQAASLLSQHRHALALHRNDPFRRKYMGWLVHFEFGEDCRPFLLPEGATARMNRLDPDYWLASWIGVHRHLLAQSAEVRARQVFIDYDLACKAPLHAAEGLGAATGVRIRPDLRASGPHPVLGFDPALVARANALHDSLRERAI